jgi:hypothetical protein
MSNVVSTSDICISVELLKSKSNVQGTDAMMAHLAFRCDDCMKRRIEYWNHFSKMKFRHNCISIPLLIASSATGVVSAYQFSGKNTSVNIVVTGLAGISAILSSVQRYCSYSERAENSKLMAKSWGRLHRKIKNTMTYINSEATDINSTVFTKLVDEIQKDIEAVAQQADEMPDGLLKIPSK